MSWLWGSSKPASDATSNLDPSLQDFLQQETARSQAATKSQSRSGSQANVTGHSTEYTSQYSLDKERARHHDLNKSAADSDRPAVPPQSQFQDGRYADLWKTYRTQEEIAATSYTDQDMLKTVTENYKDRKAAVGRAALANCAMEQLAQHTCFVKGSWAQLSTLCNAEGAAFNRCYAMQSKFLKALGYLSMPSSPEEEERIQMHADKLYQEMLRREKAAEEAKVTGIEPEPVRPLLQADEIEQALGKDSAFMRMRQSALERSEGAMQSFMQSLKPEDQAKLREKLGKLSPEERALELQLMAADLRVNSDLQSQLQKVREEEVKQRRLRREEGGLTIGDRLKDLTGWAK